MTNFLLHLAQRSVGLAPLVRARALPALEAAAPTGPIGETAPLPSYPRAAVPAEPSPVNLGSMARFPDDAPRFAPPPRPIAEAQSAPQPAPIPQRTSETADSPAPPTPRPPIDIETRPARPVAEATPTVEIPVPRDRLEKTIIIQTAVPAPPVVLPVPLPDADTRTPSVIPVPLSATPGEHRDIAASIAPRGSEFSQQDRSEPKFSDISVKPANLERRPVANPDILPPRPIAPPTPPPENRVVHVRIGAIEVHGAASPAAASAAPLTAPAQRAALVNGFDSFSRLRSYAPWEW